MLFGKIANEMGGDQVSRERLSNDLACGTGHFGCQLGLPIKHSCRANIRIHLSVDLGPVLTLAASLFWSRFVVEHGTDNTSPNKIAAKYPPVEILGVVLFGDFGNALRYTTIVLGRQVKAMIKNTISIVLASLI